MNDHPKLTELAAACNNGACNLSGILRSLGTAVLAGELQPHQYQDSLELKIIIGQVSYLLGEGPGPSMGALEQYLIKTKPLTAYEQRHA